MEEKISTPFGMVMPGRSGRSGSGGWTTSSGTSSLPANLSYDSPRTSGSPSEYRATVSIEFLPGFESREVDAFEAYITTDNGSGGTGTGDQGYAGGGYRYGFNGKEQDPDTYGDGNIYDYGFRIYNPRIGKFLSVDPLAKSYPWNSPYSYAEGDVIRSIDLDGLEKYKVVGRSFAPRGSFEGTHFESKADDRTRFEIATYKSVSARIHVQLTINMYKEEAGIKKEISSQPTILKGGSRWDIDRQSIHLSRGSYVDPVNNSAWVKGDYYAKNGTDIGPGIDIQFQISMEGRPDWNTSKKPSENVLKIETTITGNAFPAQETMIFDEKGTGLFLGVSMAKGSPLSGVWGTGEGNVLSKTSLNVQTDESGNFLGVYTKDEKGVEKVMSPQAYNKQFKDQKVWDGQDGRKDYEKK